MFSGGDPIDQHAGDALVQTLGETRPVALCVSLSASSVVMLHLCI